MNGAQHFILIQPRADGLPDLGEQFVLLGAAVSVMRDQIVLDSEPSCNASPTIRRGPEVPNALRWA